MDAPLTSGDETRVRFAWLPRPGTLAYHLMLAAVALLIRPGGAPPRRT
jgi:hypothetical protein